MPVVDYAELIDRLQQAGFGYPDVETAVTELYQSGKSLRQISKLTGSYVSINWLRLKLTSLGVTIRPRGGNNNPRDHFCLPESEWEQYTCQDLASKYGVSPSTVGKAARRQGYAPKKVRKFFRKSR